MKNILKSFIITILSVFLVHCDESFDPVSNRGAVVPTITDVSPSFYDFLSLEEAYVQFTVNIEEGKSVEAVIIQASYNGLKQRIEIAREVNFPATFTVSVVDVASKLGLDFSKVVLGDIFNLEVVVAEKGQELRSNANLNANVACASDIAGVYNLSASGVGGNGLDAPEPWISKLTEVNIVSKDGGITYTITPALGGIMESFYSAYGGDIVTGEFQDVCGVIANAVVHDGWNALVKYEGVIDEDTGVITIIYESDWGDNATMILTPR